MPVVVHQPTATHDWVIEDSQRALLEGNFAKAAMNQDVNHDVFMKNWAALRPLKDQTMFWRTCHCLGERPHPSDLGSDAACTFLIHRGGWSFLSI